MPGSFDLSADYAGSVAAVHRAFADEQYWLERLADSGADGATLDSLVLREDGSIDIATTQVLRRDRLPGVVTQFLKGDLRVERSESWGPVSGNAATASTTGAIPGAPVTVSGTASLAPSGPGSRLKANVIVEVRIPFVGGKIESFIGKSLVDLLIAEQRFTTAWLAQQA